MVGGTDTGVGKTVFLSLLCNFIVQTGHKVLPLKPFCSGGKEDLNMILSAHGQGLKESEINFWYIRDSISPATWEFRTGCKIDIDQIFDRLKKWENFYYDCDFLLVEGVGGLLAPIAQKHTIATIGKKLGLSLILIAPNRVGVINHVLMTLEVALGRGLSVACVVLMQQEEPDLSAIDNAELIRMHLPEMDDFKGVYEFPWLGAGADNPALIAVNVKKAEGVLGMIFEECILPSL